MAELSLPDSSLGTQDPSLGAEDSVVVVQLLNRVSLWPHGLQQARLLCPSPSTGACSNSCPSSRWCLPTTSSSVIPFSSCLQSFPASGSYSSESALRIRWPKYWSFSLSISPFSEFSGLISFRLDWFDLLAVQGTLKCLLQLHSPIGGSVPSFSFLLWVSRAWHLVGLIWSPPWKPPGCWAHSELPFASLDRLGFASKPPGTP